MVEDRTSSDSRSGNPGIDTPSKIRGRRKYGTAYPILGQVRRRAGLGNYARHPPTFHMPFFASCFASDFSRCGTPCIEMLGSEYSDTAWCEFGVRVARIHGVSVASMKTARSGRKGGVGTCYNRRRINDLGTAAARAEIAQFSHRH